MGKTKDTTPKGNDENTTPKGNDENTTPKGNDENTNQTAGNAPAENPSLETPNTSNEGNNAQPANTPSNEGNNAQAEVEKATVMQVTSIRGLRLRKGPGAEFEVMRILPKGSLVTIIELPVDIPGWLCVSAEEETGFVMVSFLAKVEE